MSNPIQPCDPNVVAETESARGLLERVAVGDRVAFHVFYERYAARVMAVVRRSVSEAAIAEELVQEIFVAAWLTAPRYRPDLGEPGSWLFGIARHKIVDHARRMRRIAAAVELHVGPGLAETRRPDFERRIGLERALAELTVDQRRVIDLIYHTGLTFTEAARMLKIPAGTVKSRVNAALSAMRVFLKGSVLS